MPPTTRRTRAHPSPTGLKSLEMTTKKKKTSKTISKTSKPSRVTKNTKEAAHTAKPKSPIKPKPSSPAPAVDFTSSSFPTAPDAFGISDDEEEPQASFVRATHTSICPTVNSSHGEKDREEQETEEGVEEVPAEATEDGEDEDSGAHKEDTETAKDTTEMPTSAQTISPPTPSTTTPTRSNWARLSNLTTILSPRNLLRTPLNFWGRRQQDNAQTGRVDRLNPPNTPEGPQSNSMKQPPATISHPQRTRATPSKATQSNIKKTPRTIDSKRIGRRPDSHLPLHLRGCLYRDLPKEWQARSAHMRPTEEKPGASTSSNAPIENPTPTRISTPSERVNTSTESFSTLKRKRQNTNPSGTFVAPVLDNSDDDDDVPIAKEKTSGGDSNPPSQRSFSPSRTTQSTKQPVYLTPRRQTSPEKSAITPSSSFYESGGRTYSRTIYPKKAPDFKPTFAVPELDSDSSDEEEDEDEELHEPPAKRQHIEQTPDNRLNKVRQDALRHASKVPSHLSQVQIMSPAMVTPRFSQKILDVYANLRLPIIDQDLIEIVENWDYTPYLMKFRKRKIESWADPDEDEMRRQGILA